MHIASGAGGLPKWSGLVCNRCKCQNPSTLDTTPPDLVAGSVAVAPARVKAGGAFAVTLQVTEALESPPGVVLGLVPPVALSCTATSTVAYSCAHTATGHENGDLGGDIALDVRLRDLAGNDTARSSVATVTFDFAPPSPTVASVGYSPGPDSPITVVGRATAGTVVTVAVAAGERLSATTAPALVARSGGVAVPFALASGGLADSEAVFVTTVSGGLPDGDYALEVAWSDEVGNAGTTAVPATMRVQTSLPALVVDQGALVFVRSPTGNAAGEPLGGYTIPAGPYFALEPSDALTSSPSLPAGALLLADGTVPSAVLVQAGAEEGALVLGLLRPDPGSGGRFPRQRLLGTDALGVWLVGVDDAGNRSAPVQLRTSECVATPRPPALGASDHALFAAGFVTSTLVQDGAWSTVSRAAAGGADGDAAVARSAAVWQSARTAALAPPARSRHAVAFDAARGRTVLFGGISSSATLQDTWEWDGSTWSLVATSGPAPRYEHRMVYDGARGRVVLFGGTTATGQVADTWEWDGSTWTQVATAGPLPRWGFAMAFDSGRGRVVLFGGVVPGVGVSGETWEWDGRSWSLVSNAGPPARFDHAMEYDRARGEVVLFAGRASTSGSPFADTWTWNGTTWSRVATTGPAGRVRHTLAYDAARGRTVLFGGVVFLFNYDPAGAAQDTWEWDGTTWAQRASGGPAVRYDHAMTWDPLRGRTLLFGGESTAGRLGDTWTWDGASWSRPPAAAPPPRSSPGLAYDSLRRRTVLFGGGLGMAPLGDTWELDGDRWTSIASPGPSNRTGHGLAYDAAHQHVVLFGGSASPSTLHSDTWTWDGTSWTSVTSSGPSARASHAMTYDSARGRVVLFGGASGTDGLGDTWEWDGAVWTSVATSGPSPRFSAAMTYDAARARVVLAGGYGPSGPVQDTWEWDGATWTQRVLTLQPAARHAAGMTYDAARRRVVLFGGISGSSFYQDTWEWEGAAWTRASTSGPDPRGAHGMVYAADRGRTVVFGGIANSGVYGDTWEWSAAPDRTPAVQFEASAASFGVDPSFIETVLVRAFAGGTFDPGGATTAGVTLYGWATRGDAREPGAWLPLAASDTGIAGQAPYLPAPPASLLWWRSGSGAEARLHVRERDGILAFQVRPSGGAGDAPDGAAVALDYIEVRVRYAVPP